MASAVLAALAAAAFILSGVKGQYFLLANEQTGRILFYERADNGSEFAVSFTHSVNKSPVTEYYRIEDNQIYLCSLRFYSFGAGMPTEPEDGQIVRYEDGAMIIDGFNRPMPYLCYSIGRIAGHALHWQGKVIPLDSLDTPGQPVLFTVGQYSRRELFIKPAGGV